MVDDTDLDEEQKLVKKNELEYIKTTVLPKRNNMREKKTDEELLDDSRFLGKYGQFLLDRVKNRNDYERLRLKKPNGGNYTISPYDKLCIDGGKVKRPDIKKSYMKLVRVFHPDNIKKQFKY